MRTYISGGIIDANFVQTHVTELSSIMHLKISPRL